MSILRRLGSLRFAVFLIASLVLILSSSTVLESIYGTPFAQKNFYAAHWFDLFLSLLWINIFCAACSRYPFKKYHTGFVITHIGILTLLIGAFLTRIAGAEGQMTLYENTTKDQILRPGFVLSVEGAGGPKETFNLKSKAAHLPALLPLKDKETGLTIAEILEHAAEKRFLIESGDPRPNAAVHLNLTSALMGFNEKFTLIASDPDNPASASKEVGPAHFILKKNSEGGPEIKLKLKQPGFPAFEMDLGGPPKDKISVGNSGLEITDLRYYPHAKVADNRIVNAPGDAPFNPAVEFQVHDAKGRGETHTKFLLFPDFPSIRGGKKADFFTLDVSLEASTEDAAAGAASFVIYPSTEASWHYEIYSSKGLLKKGALKLHDKIETGWRDITVEVLQMFNRAQILRKVSPAAEGAGGSFALRIHQTKQGASKDIWLTEDRPATLETQKRALRLALEPVKATLPFELTLKDFRKTDYPGTSSPASFESDVTLFDPVKKITLEKTIRMNEPLDYAGWRIFQASYLQDPELGEASVFTIAKNPGIQLIYSGGIIILIGVILLFYFHPFFNPSVRSKSVQ